MIVVTAISIETMIEMTAGIDTKHTALTRGIEEGDEAEGVVEGLIMERMRIPEGFKVDSFSVLNILTIFR